MYKTLGATRTKRNLIASLLMALALMATLLVVPGGASASPFPPFYRCGVLPPTDASPGPLAMEVDNLRFIEFIPCPEPSQLIPQLRVTPDRVVSTNPENLVTYSFKVKNDGKGAATSVRLEIPVPAGLVAGYLDPASDAGVWVSDLSNSQVKVALPKLNPGQSVSGKMVFRPSGAASGTEVTASYNLFFDDEALASQKVRSNLQYFTFGADNLDQSQGAVQPGAGVTAKVGEVVVMTQNVYLASEQVTLWYSGPDGKTLSLGTVWSDPNGVVTVSLSTSNAVPGVYSLVGFGNRSEVSEVSTLTLLPAE